MEQRYDLDALKRHPSFPFDDWRHDDASFELAKRYWAELVRDVLGETHEKWVPRFDTERDGNPVLSLVNEAIRYGLRVVLYDGEGNESAYPDSPGSQAGPWLYPYMNAGRLPDGETPVNELVLLASIHPQVEHRVRDLIFRHCVRQETAERMEAIIEDHEVEMGMR
jgi:hypothetical protein